MSFHSLSLPDFPSTFDSPPILPSNQNYTEDRPFPLLWWETHQPGTGKEQVRYYSPHMQALSSLRQQGQKVIFRFTGIHIPWMMMGWVFLLLGPSCCSRKQEVFLHRLAGLSTGHKRCTRWLTWAVARSSCTSSTARLCPWLSRAAQVLLCQQPQALWFIKPYD